MSRFHISYTLRCIENPSWNSNSSSFCADYRRVTQNDMNSLSAMLLASATYLSSHMATSLAALIHDDNFWSTYRSDWRRTRNSSTRKEKRKLETTKNLRQEQPFLGPESIYSGDKLRTRLLHQLEDYEHRLVSN